MPLAISRQWVEDVVKTMPELPEQRRKRYTAECGLSVEDAAIIAESKDDGRFFRPGFAIGRHRQGRR